MYLVVVENYRTGETIKTRHDDKEEAIKAYKEYCDYAVEGLWDEVYFTAIQKEEIYGRE